MKVIIEQDMEGVAGLVGWGYDLKKTGRMDAAIRCMTDEVNAAVEGAVAAGATEVIACEAHPYDYERLHPKAQLFQGVIFDAPGGADALFFVGRHAMSNVADGVLSHTGSSRSIREVRVNGRAFGEMGLCAALFGGRGIPTALVTGDEAACREAHEFFEDVEAVSVKKGFGLHSALSLSHDESCRVIREGASRALGRLAAFKPFTVEGAVTIEVEFTRPQVAEWVCRIPRIERTDPRTTRYEAENYEAALRMYYAQGAMLWRFDAY